MEGKRDARVSCGFIDGRNVQVDARGYQVPAVKPVDVRDVPTPIKDDETHTDTNGWTYTWAKTPSGIRYKKYLSSLTTRQVTP